MLVLALEGGAYSAVVRQAAGAVVWLLVLLVVVFRRPAKPPVPAMVVAAGVPLALYVGWIGMSALWAESAGAAFDDFTRGLLYLGVFVLVVMVVWGRPGDDRLERAARTADGLALGAAAVVMLAVLSRMEPSIFPLQELQELAPQVRPRLTYPLNYWNGLAAFVAMTVPLLLTVSVRPEVRGALRAAAAAVVPSAVLAIYLTFSRGGLLAAVVAVLLVVSLTSRRGQLLVSLGCGLAGGAVLVALTRSMRAINDGLMESAAGRSEGHRLLIAWLVVTALVFAVRLLLFRVPPLRVAALASRRLQIIAVAAAVAVGAVAVASAAGEVGSVIDDFKNPIVFKDGVTNDRIESRFFSASGNGRFQYWSSAFDALEKHPVAGIGSGSWRFWWQRDPTLGGTVRDSHSIVADTAAELGGLGLLLLLALFAAASVVAVRALRGWPQAHRPTAAALAALVLTFVLNASIDWLWELPAVTVLFAAALGLLAAPVAAPRKREQEVDDAARGGLGTWLVVGVVAWAALFAQAVPLLGAWNLNRSEAAAARGDFTAALDHAETARTLQPWAAPALLQIAQVQEDRHEYDAAIAYARQAIDKEPTNWQNWFVLARIEASSGRADEARRDLLEARRLNPLSPIWPRLGL